MATWNKMSIFKLLWALAFKTDKLRVKWINVYHFKSHNIYTVTISSSTSRLLRKMISTRDLRVVGGWEAVASNGKLNIKKTYTMLQGDFHEVERRRLI